MTIRNIYLQSSRVIDSNNADAYESPNEGINLFFSWWKYKIDISKVGAAGSEESEQQQTEECNIQDEHIAKETYEEKDLEAQPSNKKEGCHGRCKRYGMIIGCIAIPAIPIVVILVIGIYRAAT